MQDQRDYRENEQQVDESTSHVEDGEATDPSY
jgi:hypothetical protein